jgi:hypothetical protein
MSCLQAVAAKIDLCEQPFGQGVDTVIGIVQQFGKAGIVAVLFAATLGVCLGPWRWRSLWPRRRPRSARRPAGMASSRNGTVWAVCSHAVVSARAAKASTATPRIRFF